MESQIAAPQGVPQRVLRLVENSDSYNLIIPEEVQKKIREWCYISNSTEWSGTLFYRPSGSFENKDLVITVADFLVSDIGSSGYTEYDVKPEVISYMLENDLLDCKMGLIHSHNKMSAFFSGTDTNTLESEGKDTAHFVSLIVNNDGKYVARITRKIIEKINGHKTVIYPTFEESTIVLEDGEYEEESLSYIEYFNLNIIIEENTTLKDSVAQRYKEIMDNKREVVKSAYGGSGYNGYGGYYGNFHGYNGRNWGDEEVGGEDNYPSLFQHQQAQKKEEKEQEKKEEVKKNEETTSEAVSLLEDMNPDLLAYHLSKDVLDAAVGQALFGCITFSAESYRKQNVEKWIDETMEKVLDRRFGSNTKAYEMYMAGVAEVITRNVVDPELRKTLYQDSREASTLIDNDMCCICAKDVILELEKLTKGKPHKYIDIIIACFLDFIYG